MSKSVGDLLDGVPQLAQTPGIPAGSGGRLHRELSYRDLLFYGLAYISPIAPFSTLYFVWDAADGFVVLAYLLGAVCMYFTARSYATMSQGVPNAGSVYGFATHAIGSLAGYLAGWLILLDYLLVPAFVYLLMSVALETLLPTVDRGVWVVLIMLLTLTINWFGIKVASRVNIASVAIQIVLLLLVLVLGFGVLAADAEPVLGGPAPSLLGEIPVSAVLAGTSICMLSFLGFDAVSTLAEEVKDGDRRIVGRAIMHGLALCALFFVAQTWVLGSLLNGFQIGDPAAAAYNVVSGRIAPWLGGLIAWTMATIVGITALLTMQNGVARVLFAMARDRHLPVALARLDDRRSTPWTAMLAATAVSVGVAFTMRDSLDALASLINFGALSGFFLLHVSVLAGFGRRSDCNVFVHRIVPIAGIAVVTAVFSGLSSFALWSGSAWLAAGLAFWAIARRLGAGWRASAS